MHRNCDTYRHKYKHPPKYDDRMLVAGNEQYVNSE